MKTLDPCMVILSIAELRVPMSNVCFFAAMDFVSLHLIIRDSERKCKNFVPLYKLSHISLTSRALFAKTQESLHTPTRYLTQLYFFRYFKNIVIFIGIYSKSQITLRRSRNSVGNLYSIIPKYLRICCGII